MIYSAIVNLTTEHREPSAVIVEATNRLEAARAIPGRVAEIYGVQPEDVQCTDVMELPEGIELANPLLV